MREIFVSLTLSVFLASCGGSSNSSCTECGGGLVDDFQYKEVTVDDIAGLAEIDVIVDVGKCIRFKSDETELFSEATVVDDCCCIEYQ
jgi:hypothetical protein